jgi:hypothetical protein
VFPAIEQHIDEPVSNLSRGPERAAVVAVGKDATAPPEPAVDRLREPDAEALHSACERARSVGLYEKMKMIRLDGEVHDAKIDARARGEGPLHDRADTSGPQGWQAAHAPKRDVKGMAPVVEQSSPVRHARRRTDGFPSGTGTPPAAAAEG